MNTYVIVKQAGAYWDFYWDVDPKLTGASISNSACYTHTGSILGIQPTYKSLPEAKLMCDALNKINPSGDYAVCPFVEEIEQ